MYHGCQIIIHEEQHGKGTEATLRYLTALKGTTIYKNESFRVLLVFKKQLNWTKNRVHCWVWTCEGLVPFSLKTRSWLFGENNSKQILSATNISCSKVVSYSGPNFNIKYGKCHVFVWSIWNTILDCITWNHILWI